MEGNFATIGVLFIFGAVSAKWALELGFSQLSQIAHFLAGLFIGPLVLLTLYIRLINQRKEMGLLGSQYIGSGKNVPTHA